MRQFLLLAIILTLFQSYGQKPRCATMEKWNFRVQEQPQLIYEREQLEEFTRRYIENLRHNEPLGEDAVVTIPVVVHVVYRSGANNNISDAQIYSQIEVLNEDYRRRNSDTIKTPAVFKPRAADMEIEFCLAAEDPFGNDTNGITRTQTTRTAVGDIDEDYIYFTAKGGHDAWNTSKYLNIWVCEISTNFSILGYTSLPGSSPDPFYDGLVIDHRAFGTLGTAVSPYNLGRTATHELGHFFNLLHPWGPDESNPNCTRSDAVADTPPTTGPFFDCPTHPQMSCDSMAMFMNFMDYVDDNCMNLFTKGQKNRAQAALNSDARKSLKNAVTCAESPTPVIDHPFEAVKYEIYPNPAGNTVYFSVSVPARMEMQISMVDMMGREVWSREMQTGTKVWPVDVSGLPAGMYFFHLFYEGEKKIGKLMVYHH